MSCNIFCKAFPLRKITYIKVYLGQSVLLDILMCPLLYCNAVWSFLFKTDQYWILPAAYTHIKSIGDIFIACFHCLEIIEQHMTQACIICHFYGIVEFYCILS